MVSHATLEQAPEGPEAVGIGPVIVSRPPWLGDLDRLKVKAKRARYVGRPASASTAAGQMSRHQKELQAFLNDAFA